MATPRTKTGHANSILAALPEDQLRTLLAGSEHLHFKAKTDLLVVDKVISHVYFPESGSTSIIAALEDGARAEVGLIGNEGFIGIPLIFGLDTSALQAMVQIEGEVLAVSVADFRRLLVELPALLPLLLKYAAAHHLQVAQTAACNSRHQVEQRLARWILMSHDRAGRDRFLMTHEFISIMLGVRRASITVAIGALVRAGVVAHAAGFLTVTNRAGLEAESCKCYRQARDHIAKIMRSPSRRDQQP